MKENIETIISFGQILFNNIVKHNRMKEQLEEERPIDIDFINKVKAYIAGCKRDIIKLLEAY